LNKACGMLRIALLCAGMMLQACYVTFISIPEYS
jgi:hypothetical protein